MNESRDLKNVTIATSLVTRAPAWVLFIILGPVFYAGLEQGLLPAKVRVLLGGVFLIGWLYPLTVALIKRLPEAPMLSFPRFRFHLLYVPVYLLLFVTTVPLLGEPSSWMVLLILPLHLLAMYSLIYTFYFVARALVIAEDGAPQRVNRYIGTTPLIAFFPVGIWFIQPRINRLFAGTPR